MASYLTIMQFRLGERLRFKIAPAAELEDVPFPPLLLQTLVENALRHGIEPRAEGGFVEITIERIAEKIVVRVRDDGVGLAAGSEPGVGLRNTRERLASFYAGRASFELLPGATVRNRGRRLDSGSGRMTTPAAIIADDEPLLRSELREALAELWPELA